MKTKVIRRHTEASSLHTGAPTVHWEDKIIYIYVVEAKILTPRVKPIDIPVYFLQEQFGNDLFLPKDEKYSFVPADMCTKPCLGPIISRSNKRITGFRFYPTSDTEHYELMRFNEYIVN